MAVIRNKNITPGPPLKAAAPLVEKIPGLIKSEVSKLKVLPGTESDYYMMAEMYYEDMDAFNAAMASPEGKASARDLVNFAKNMVDFYLGKVK